MSTCPCPRIDGYVIPRKSCQFHARPEPQPEVEAARNVDAEAIEIACAWSDYRKGYGVYGSQQHKAFVAGWKAARGADHAGVQR